MARIIEDDGSTGRAKLDLASIRGRDVVLTIATAEQIEIEDKEQPAGVRRPIVLSFKEFPGHEGKDDAPVWWVNKTMRKTLIARLGNDLDRWIGQRVPYTKGKSHNPRTGETVDTLFAMNPEEWDEALKAARQASKRKGQ